MLDKFSPIRRLGQGSFGEVWLVNDLSVDAERAVKIVPLAFVPNPENYFQEAQLLKAAEHQNVVRVHYAECDEENLYVVMEYLPAGSLERLITGGPLRLTTAKRIGIDVLRGLQHAHSRPNARGRGILHKDVKPGNILLGGHGEAMLSDFGLAERPGETGDGPDMFYGPHGAPELHAGLEFTAASDIYATGVTIYRIVNGDNYLPALSRDAMEQRIQAGRYPDRARYRAYVPRALRTVINKAMSLDPVNRYETAEAFQKALEQIPLYVDWFEYPLGVSGHLWRAETEGLAYQVELEIVSPKEASVVLRKGRSFDTLRRQSKQCRSGLVDLKAKQIASDVLQGIVTGKVR